MTLEDNHIRDNLINDRNRTALDKIMDKELQEKEKLQQLINQQNPTAMAIITSNANPQENADIYGETAELLNNTSTQRSQDASAISDITREAQREEMMLIKKLMNTDLDSTEGLGEKIKKVREINTNEECSVASSITMQSNTSKSTTTSDVKSEYSLNSQETNNSTNSSIPVNGRNFTLEAIGVTQDMTEEEVRLRLEAHMAHQRNKENLRKEEVLQAFIHVKNKVKDNPSDANQLPSPQKEEQTTQQEESQDQKEQNSSNTNTSYEPNESDKDQPGMPASSKNTGEEKLAHQKVRT